VTVLARNDDTLSVVRGLGVKTIKASLQDADVLTKEVASHDVSRGGAAAGDTGGTGGGGGARCGRSAVWPG
jgi:hypothetical protein